MSTIRITIGGPENEGGRLDGFVQFWCKAVREFDIREHCALCLIGTWIGGIRQRMKLTSTIEVDAELAPFFYLCGVDRPGGNQGLHIAFQYEEGSRIEDMTYNGVPVVIENARRLDIPEPPKGLRFSERKQECWNWRFGYAHLRHRLGKAHKPWLEEPKKEKPAPAGVQESLF